MLKKIIILIAIGAIIWAFQHFGITSYLNLAELKAQQGRLQGFYIHNQLAFVSIYFVIYVITTALSIPGATILTLAGGAIFGLWQGTIIVSFASTVGATVAFLISRIFFQAAIEKRFKDTFRKINAGVENEGAFYLFTLRLVPLFPFFLINLTMGLTTLKTWTFYWVSQLGMLAGTIVYVNAGEQLSQIESLKDIMSFDLIFAFSLLGLFPLVAKKIIDMLKAGKVYRPYKKPKKFEYNMLVIGAGAAGLVTSYISAAVKARVGLIEKHKMGGDCLNTGCVPSKALLKSAKAMHTINNAGAYGIKTNGSAQVDFPAVMQRVHEVITKIEPHDSIERYTDLGVECITGAAKIISPWEVEVNGKVLTTKNITIATGARPFVPQIKGLSDIDYLVSDNLWEIKELPEHLVVLGAGPIGLEMALAFVRLGSKVTVIQRSDRVMNKEDVDIAEVVQAQLIKEGIEFLFNHNVIEVTAEHIVCETLSGKVQVPYGRVLVAVGRAANTSGFGLEELGVELNENKTVKVNEYMQTNFPNIYACGDVAGPFQLTHMASHQAWYCAVNGLFSPFKKFAVDYSVVPWVTYLDPEVAHVGATEEDLKAMGQPYDVIKYDVSDLDRAIADSVDHGVVKVLVSSSSDSILGVSIVAQNAGELITEFISAMKHGKGLNSILSTIHSYPTMSEANKYAAGVWKKKTAPQKLLTYVEKFHTWRRS
jgi:pyruvate/2-oxoglutarate dehydrogenase complex dihydrolipoamide dehydrogenase (E3) component/uncharacterized membrane protein YdjX (TVP38/TMEM64 family)